jgi:MFS transporter, YNFM family, putative membrane transport protein
MFGRLLAAVLSDFYSWHIALAVLGSAGLYAAWEFWRSLPPARHFRPAALVWRNVGRGLWQHVCDPGLVLLYGLAFVLMGSFVSLYNYLGYRLLGAPYGLSQSSIGAISLLYLLGMVSAIWVGRLVDRVGRRSVLWRVLLVMLGGLLLTLSARLPVILLGTAVFTFGFFASHSVASSWVARRAAAPKALASAIYLCCYYLGSSVLGAWTGVLWAGAGWHGVVLALGVCLCAALAMAVRLRSVPIAAL